MSGSMTRNDLLSKEYRATCEERSTDHLDPAEFCRLLLSRRHLIRDNKTGATADAVIDLISGKRYQVDLDRLNRFIERAAG